MVAGKAQNEVVATEEGEIEVQKRMTVRWSFDERVEDGLYCVGSLRTFQEHLEDPGKFIDWEQYVDGPPR